VAGRRYLSQGGFEGVTALIEARRSTRRMEEVANDAAESNQLRVVAKAEIRSAPLAGLLLRIGSRRDAPGGRCGRTIKDSRPSLLGGPYALERRRDVPK
jgi:hypothetical protein